MDLIVRAVGALLSRLHASLPVNVCPGDWAWTTTIAGGLVALLPVLGAVLAAVTRRFTGNRYGVPQVLAFGALGGGLTALAPWLLFYGTSEVFREASIDRRFGLTRGDLRSLGADYCFAPTQGQYLGGARTVREVVLSLPSSRPAVFAGGLVLLVVLPLLCLLFVFAQSRLAFRRGPKWPARLLWLPMPLLILGTAGLSATAVAHLWLGFLPASVIGMLAVALVGAPRQSVIDKGSAVAGADGSGARNSDTSGPGPAPRPTPTPAGAGPSHGIHGGPRPSDRSLGGPGPGGIGPGRNGYGAPGGSAFGAAGAAGPFGTPPRGVPPQHPGQQYPGQQQPGQQYPGQQQSGQQQPGQQQPGQQQLGQQRAGQALPPRRPTLGLPPRQPSGPVGGALAADPGPLPESLQRALGLAAGLATPADPHDLPDTPTLPASRFRRIRRLGTGGFGTVWLAMDTVLDRTVAVKVAKVPDAETERRIRREARALAAVHHPNCVRIYDILTDADGELAIVMEYVPGRSLSMEMEAAGRLPDPAAARLWATLAGALHAAHGKGVLHRDVKPSNIIIDDGGFPHLIDFGIARSAGDVTLTAAGMVLGTPDFMPPELAAGRPAGPASDAWQLAATISYALAGKPPRGHRDGPIAAMLAAAQGEPCNQIPPRTAHRALLEQSLHPDPARRPGLPTVQAELTRWLTAIGQQPDGPITERLTIPPRTPIPRPEPAWPTEEVP